MQDERNNLKMLILHFGAIHVGRPLDVQIKIWVLKQTSLELLLQGCK